MGDGRPLIPVHLPFGSSLWAFARQLLWLVQCDDIFSSSLVLVILHDPSPRLHGVSSRKIEFALTLAIPFSMRLHCPRSFKPRRFQQRLCK
jgi:hypothetical protein